MASGAFTDTWIHPSQTMTLSIIDDALRPSETHPTKAMVELFAATKLADLELAVRWRTPPRLYDALDAEFHFAIDAAADVDSTLCGDWLGPGSALAENALLMDEGILPGAAFLNFPYSTKLAAAYNKLGRTEDARTVRAEEWVQWAAEEGQYYPVVGIVPASWDAKWWVKYVWGRAAEIRCLDHRIQFLHPVTGEPGTQPRDKHAIVIWQPSRYMDEDADPVVRYWDYREETQQ